MIGTDNLTTLDPVEFTFHRVFSCADERTKLPGISPSEARHHRNQCLRLRLATGIHHIQATQWRT